MQKNVTSRQDDNVRCTASSFYAVFNAVTKSEDKIFSLFICIFLELDILIKFSFKSLVYPTEVLRLHHQSSTCSVGMSITSSMKSFGPTT